MHTTHHADADNATVESESKKVLREDEKNVDAMINLAVSYHRSGKFELAIAVLDNAKALQPKEPEIYWRLSQSRLALKDKLRARLVLEEATRLDGQRNRYKVLGGAALLPNKSTCDTAAWRLHGPCSNAKQELLILLNSIETPLDCQNRSRREPPRGLSVEYQFSMFVLFTCTHVGVHHITLPQRVKVNN